MKHKIEFGFGIGRDKDGMHIPATMFIPALAQIKKKAVELFGGYTVYTTQGGWISGNGKLVEEDGRTLMVYTKDSEINSMPDIKVMAEFIKEQLNQEAVYVSQQHVSLTQI